MSHRRSSVLGWLAVLSAMTHVGAACSATGESAGPESTPSTDVTADDATTDGVATAESGDPLPLGTSGDDDRVEFVTSTSMTTTTTLPPTTMSTTTTSTTTTSTTTTSTTTTTTIPAPTTIRCSFAADALFEPGEAALTAAAIDELERIVAETSDIRRVTVEGHTDHRGTDAENLALSQARADVTAAALVDAGIDEELISAAGLGESQAAQGDPSDSEMAADRRVDVVIEADVPIATTC
jgi:outer membrane protein OmpA-like peptidoglycan-associated protein